MEACVDITFVQTPKRKGTPAEFAAMRRASDALSVLESDLRKGSMDRIASMMSDEEKTSISHSAVILLVGSGRITDPSGRWTVATGYPDAERLDRARRHAALARAAIDACISGSSIGIDQTGEAPSDLMLAVALSEDEGRDEDVTLPTPWHGGILHGSTKEVVLPPRHGATTVTVSFDMLGTRPRMSIGAVDVTIDEIDPVERMRLIGTVDPERTRELRSIVNQ